MDVAAVTLPVRVGIRTEELSEADSVPPGGERVRLRVLAQDELTNAYAFVQQARCGGVPLRESVAVSAGQTQGDEWDAIATAHVCLPAPAADPPVASEPMLHAALGALQRGLDALCEAWSRVCSHACADAALLLAIERLCAVVHALPCTHTRDGAPEEASAEPVTESASSMRSGPDDDILFACPSITGCDCRRLVCRAYPCVSVRPHTHIHGTAASRDRSAAENTSRIACVLDSVNYAWSPRQCAWRARTCRSARACVCTRVRESDLLPNVHGLLGMMHPESSAMIHRKPALPSTPSLGALADVYAELTRCESVCVRACVDVALPPEGHRLNPHTLLRATTSSMQAAGWSISTLQTGAYAYYHYGQDGVRDGHWGCAHRATQTLAAWIVLASGGTTRAALAQHSAWLASAKPVAGTDFEALPSAAARVCVPMHKDMQAMLVRAGDKPAAFVGSREWIGSQEVSIILREAFGVECITVHCPSRGDVSAQASRIREHFARGGGPIMIGGGVLAFTIVGVATAPLELGLDDVNGVQLLLLDPHYTGADDDALLTRTTTMEGYRGAPIEWRPVSTLAEGCFFNLCFAPPL